MLHLRQRNVDTMQAVLQDISRRDLEDLSLVLFITVLANVPEGRAYAPILLEKSPEGQALEQHLDCLFQRMAEIQNNFKQVLTQRN